MAQLSPAFYSICIHSLPSYRSYILYRIHHCHTPSMGRKYERKSQRGCDAESLKKAAEAVEKAEMSVRKAAHSYDVSRTSLQRYLSTPNDDRHSSSYQNCKTANLVFTEQMETMLAQHIRDLDHRYHGIGPAKARELAWEFGKRNQSSRMPRSWEVNQKAGKFLLQPL